MPLGRFPHSVIVGGGEPTAVGVKLLGLPSTKLALFADVMVGGWSTVRVKDWVAGLPTPLEAVIVIGKEPDVVGVPERVAVPLPLSTKVTPPASAPDSESVGVGLPVAVTVNKPKELVVKVTWLAEVMPGAA
jgi:hypothetical protein